MNHLGLFEGIGGFSLAARWAGWNTAAWCEINPFCQRVLKHHFPKARGHEDIKATDFSIYRGRIDIITGGFPCQPYSVAGKRLGKEDERHLWPEMLRAIQEVQPRWVVGENVSGLINWSGGLVFDEVHADLENQGYEVRAFVLPAASVNAPHRRDRVWFVAYSDNQGADAGLGQVQSTDGEISERNDNAQLGDTGLVTYPDGCAAGSSGQGGATESDRRKDDDEQGGGREQTEQHFGCGEFLRAASYAAGEPSERVRPQQRSACNAQQGEFGGGCGAMGDKNDTNASDTRLQGRQDNGSARSIRQESNQQPAGLLRTAWQNFPTQSPICSRNDGLPNRLDGITFPKWINESIKAYGNAIVPQVALQIFEAINEYENQ